jgi:hypothetical protein
MAKFTGTVKSVVPHIHEAEFEIEASTQDEARRVIKRMYDNDELDFEPGEHDYDEGQISEIKFDD